MSESKQRILIWWAIITLIIYGLSLIFLLHMLPPPSATWSAARIAAFYTEHNASIKLGAAICSWTAGFLVPYGVVLGIQMYRHEKGKGMPVWSILTVCGGALSSIFLVFPPIFFGAAAFTPGRAPEITAAVHEIGVLSLVTTDEWFIFLWIPVVVICLTPNAVVHSPFPRWFGYFSAWATLMFEAGAIAFMTRTGPFAWNGLLAMWLPFAVFGLWMIVMSTMILKALRFQSEVADDTLTLVA